MEGTGPEEASSQPDLVSQLPERPGLASRALNLPPLTTLYRIKYASGPQDSGKEHSWENLIWAPPQQPCQLPGVP